MGKSLTVIVVVAAAVVGAVLLLRPGDADVAATVNPTPPTDAFTETIVVRASGTAVDGVGPQMQVLVNGAVADPPSVDVAPDGGARDYSFSSDHLTEQPRIDLVFVNDESTETEDRNLLVESLVVRSTGFSPEGETVTFDIGAGDDAFDGIDTQPGTATLAVDGALRFSITLPPIATGVAGDVVVRARGAAAGDVSPQMVVRVNGRIADPPVVDVTNGSYRDYVVTTDNMTDEPVIEVAFVNDEVVGDLDRNLFIHSVRVGDLRVQSDDDRVAVDLGDSTFDPATARKGQDALYNNGVLRYEMRPVPIPPRPGIPTRSTGTPVTSLSRSIAVSPTP